VAVRPGRRCDASVAGEHFAVHHREEGVGVDRPVAKRGGQLGEFGLRREAVGERLLSES
jgi:hypothetical protein